MKPIAVALITRERREDVVQAVRSVLNDVGPDDTVHVLENGCSSRSTEGLADLFPTVHWHRSDENLGVAGGRNRLIELTEEPIIAFVDDDATVEQGTIGAVRSAFDSDARLGAVAFRIDDPATGSPRSHEYPFPGTADVDIERLCSYYVGAGYALRRDAIDDVGAFDGRFFYALEELDHAYGLIAGGWTLRYVPAARVIHHASPAGRPSGQKVHYMIQNRIVVARRWLPWRYRVSQLTLWGGLWLWRALRSGQVGHFFRGVRAGRRMARETKRTVLHDGAVDYLRENGGRLWW